MGETNDEFNDGDDENIRCSYYKRCASRVISDKGRIITSIDAIEAWDAPSQVSQVSQPPSPVLRVNFRIVEHHTVHGQEADRRQRGVHCRRLGELRGFTRHYSIESAHENAAYRP